jgi:cell volume regulation protein A
MLSEITDFAAPLALIAGALVLAVLTTSLTERVPIPAPAIFLVGAAVASDLWTGLRTEVAITTVERIAVIALILILFEGGRDIGWTTFKASIGPISTLGLVGTFATAAALTVVAHLVTGLGWAVSGVIGAALAPTDPAVMFSVLGGREIGGRSGTVLVGEAGINDPAGIALLLGMVEVATHPDQTLLVVVEDFAREISIGVAAGVAGAFVMAWLVRAVRLGGSGLYPVLMLGLAGALYGFVSLVGGSGFCAVFVAGLLLGDAHLPYGGEIERFTGALASLAEITVFVALGLTIDLSGIAGRDWLAGAALLAALAIVIRPLVVASTVLGGGVRTREKAFIAWSGLKGAVPILLAAFAILGGVAHAARIYDIVFVVVLGSVVLQGSAVGMVANRLRIPMRLPVALPWELSVGLAEPPADRLELRVQPGSWAEKRQIQELPLGGGWATLIVRDARALPARPETVLGCGDIVFVLGVDDADEVTERFATSSAGP